MRGIKQHFAAVAVAIVACLIPALGAQAIVPVPASGQTTCTHLPGNQSTPCRVGNSVGQCVYGLKCYNTPYITCTMSKELGTPLPQGGGVTNMHRTVSCVTHKGAKILKAYWLSGATGGLFKYKAIPHKTHKLKTTMRPGSAFYNGTWDLYIEVQS
ncbi:MAG: hypothetical protein ABSG64_14335 [Solirubrobacteraceae bacterium]|jgi:hypothetical protein